MIFALVELSLFVFITKRVDHLLPNPMDGKDFDVLKDYTSIQRFVFAVKQKFAPKKSLFFVISFLMS